jgi:hypothetical protein
MEFRESRAIALFAVIVLASGCASTGGGGGETSGESIVSVNSYEAIPNPATSGRTVNLNMELENTGDSDADRVVARIFGPAGFSQEENVGDRTWKDSGNEGISMSDRTVNFDTLRAAGDNTPAIPKAQSLSFTAPTLAENREVTYDFYSQIFYQYETQADTDFQLVSYDRFQEEDMTRSETTLDSGSGPIQLDIRGTTPKIFYEDENAGQINSQVCIRVINNGGGTPFVEGEVEAPRYYNVQEDMENKVRLSIQDVGNLNFDAQGDKSGNTVEVELVSGSEGFQCFDVNADVSPTTKEQNINTQITAEYGYITEDTASVTVEGRRDADITPTDGNEGGYEYEWTGAKGEVPWETTLEQIGRAGEDGPGVENEACQYLRDELPDTFQENCEER